MDQPFDQCIGQFHKNTEGHHPGDDPRVLFTDMAADIGGLLLADRFPLRFLSRPFRGIGLIADLFQLAGFGQPVMRGGAGGIGF